MPTATLEEYLEAIYKLSRSGSVRPSRLAERMGVSAPTVTATLRRLGERGLVSRPGRGIALTDEGKREALSILRRHRLAECFLVDVLGLPWDDVHQDACLLEHAMSPRVQDALERFLNNPKVCPHGHPIPGPGLTMSEPSGIPLGEVRPGTVFRVLNVDESDLETLHRIASADLLPGTIASVVGVGRDRGLVILEVGERTIELTLEAAACIMVKPAVGDAGDE